MSSSARTYLVKHGCQQGTSNHQAAPASDRHTASRTSLCGGRLSCSAGGGARRAARAARAKIRTTRGVGLLELGEFEALNLNTVGAVHSLLRLGLGHVDKLASLGVADAVLDDVGASGADGWDSEVRTKLFSLDQRLVALGSGEVGASCGRLDQAKVQFVELALKVVEVGAERDSAVVVDDYQTVVCLFLGVLVYETTTEGSHLLAVKSGNLCEDAGLDLVATIFRVLNARQQL